MKSKDSGGPAYPVLSYEYKATGDLHPSPTMYEGMSLRDWFAGMALQGAWANPDLSKAMSEAGMKPYQTRESLAASVYAQADEMIAQRDK